NLVARTARYARAMAGLGSLNKRTLSLSDSELVREVLGYCDGFLEPNQYQKEIVQLLAEVRALAPRTVLEIGTSMGGTLYLWTRIAQPDATIITLDIPKNAPGFGYSPFRRAAYRRFPQQKQTLHLLCEDSHAPDTLRFVRDLFGGRGVDFLFIDGDHYYDGVRQDWEMYAPLVKAGGIIAFHDVAMNYDGA